MTDYNLVHRYALNGDSPTSFDLGFVPDDLLINSTSGNLFASKLDGDRRVWVFSGGGTLLATLFSGPTDPNPGGIVGFVRCIALDPDNGYLYVLCEGYYSGGSQPQWISRIQRFKPDGSYDNFLINNQLGIPSDDPAFEQPNPAPPACGAWHYPYQMTVDKDDNIYLWEGVNQAGQRQVVHKFNAAKACIGTWDVTGKRVGIDPHGYPYTSVGSTLTKLNKSWDQTLYTLTGLGAVSGIRFMPDNSDFMMVGTSAGNGITRNELFGPRVEPLNIVGDVGGDDSWQNPNFPYHLITSNWDLLASCNERRQLMDGVVADGISPLLLRWKVPGPGNVRWTLSDPGNQSELSLLGTLASLDGSETDTVSVVTPVQQISGQYFAFATFTAPVNFDRANVPTDANLLTRPELLLAEFAPEGNEDPELIGAAVLSIERPPVIFVHGLWGSAGSWDDFPEIAKDPFWKDRVVRANYKPVNGQGLARQLADHTIEVKVNEARGLLGTSIVRCQVDIIVHSLGGLLIRDFAGQSAYKNLSNYGAGDFHKALFLNTPHQGTPLADAAVGVRTAISAAFDPLSPYERLAKRIAGLVGFRGMGTGLVVKTPQLVGNALDDLQTNSSVLANLPEFAVPSHAHVGDATAIFSPLTPDFQKAICIAADPAAAMAYSFANVWNFDLWPYPTDLAVPTESQKGGLTSDFYKYVTQLCESIHRQATHSPIAGDLALEWIRRRPDDISFFAPMPAGNAMQAPTFQVTTDDVYAALPNFAGQLLALTIVDPVGGTTFPGKIIRVKVQGPLFPDDLVMIYYPGGALMQTYGGVSGANGVPITIPLEHVGPFEIMAIGKRDDGQMVSSTTRTLFVDPGAKTPPATVTGIHVEPGTVVISGRGATEQLRVIAEYNDGIERDVTDTGLGTTYSPSGGIWQLTTDGVVIGVAQGSGSFIVTNSGHSVSVSTTVLNGPQINNAPHANAGGSYSACDGQQVFLDGSGSYDLDQKLGESLTYSWDLDADGQFDDATGPSPAVELNFLGASWLIGLKVTDSHGLESIDYAYLEASPGCLDGQFVCAKTRSGSGEAHVGMDGSGNLYVAEWSNTGAFNDRVVKFASNCDSIAVLALPEPPSTIFVAPNGTIYIPDDSPGVVRKYIVGGSPITPVPITGISISTLAVDAAGNIYGVDNASGTVKKYPPAGGAASATWNVGQAIGESIFVWKIAVGADGAIYAAFDDRVARGVPQGNGYVLDWVIGGSGVDAGFFDEIQGLAVGPSGDLYVSDFNNNRIQRFKSDGTLTRIWAGSGKPSNGALKGPESICVGPSDKVAVVDRRFSQPLRVQVFGTSQAIPDAELEAFTRFQQDPNNLYPQPTNPASGCPKGDADHVVIKVAIDPATVSGTVAASAFSLVLPPDDDARSYAMVQADSDATLVDGKYRTTITLRKFGGCLEQDVIVQLNGVGIGSVPIKLRSPDWVTGNPGDASYGKVDLPDLAKFGAVYTSPPKPYDACADHRGPYGQVTLPDFGHYGSHNNHTVSGGSLLANASETAQGTLRLELVEENPVVGERRLWARLILEGVEPFKVMVIALRSERRDLEYLAWHPGAGLAGATPCTELVRDGVKQVFLGVIGNAGSSGTVDLGKVEFAVNSEGELNLGDSDLAFLQAELLSIDENVRSFGGLRLERTIHGPTYQFELAQNYPNPFNPATTISFSVPRSTDVTLSLFDVRGSLVRTLVRDRREAGIHRIGWDGTDNRGSRVASGVYFYRLDAGSFHATRKMVLLR